MSEVLKNHLQSRLTQLVGENFEKSSYALAVSGGPDSMALAETFLSLLPPQKLVVCHFNHRARGEESDKDEAFVVQTFSSRCRVAVAKGEGFKSEELWRKERHAFFRKVVKEENLQFLVTAHHAQDQLETILMRLIRGTGIEGLKGMPEKEGIYLRPFLTLLREDLLQALESQKIPFREDRSNLDTKFFRNRLRAELLPPFFSLAEEFGGKGALLSRVHEMSKEAHWMTKENLRRLKEQTENMVFPTPFWIRVPWIKWLELPREWQQRLIRQFCQQLEIEIPSRDLLDRSLDRIRTKVKRVELGGGMESLYSCGQLFFSSRKSREAYHQVVEMPWRQLERNRWVHEGIRAEFCIEQPEMACRFFQPGDQFGSRKLKEVLLNQRVPEPERKILPLLVEENSHAVAWFFPLRSPIVKVQKISFPFSFPHQVN